MLQRESEFDQVGSLAKVKNASVMARALLESQAGICGVVTCSPEFRKVAAAAIRVANVDSTVLILGESGVGKGVVAELIHKMGNRREMPLIKVACGAIPDTLLESELFGYEGGAFTGARREGKRGLFEEAGNGTIFLDEVGELSPLLQVKLLNVLQDRQFLRIGGSRPIEVKARVVAATNLNLEEAVKRGRFREDLYYRLNVIPLTVPPLRERRSDIFPLINHFLRQYCQRYQLSRSISPAALNYLLRYDWPGNVRELQNIIEFLVVMSPDQIIGPRQIPDKILHAVAVPAAQSGKTNLKEALEGYEAQLIKDALHRHRTLKQAASSLGIDLSTLVRKQEKYHLLKRDHSH